MCYNKIQIFNPRSKRFISVPCGHCIPCVRRKMRDRVIRLTEEFKDPKNRQVFFCTFTYNEDNLPWIEFETETKWGYTKTVVKSVFNRRDLQLTIKRVRRYYEKYYKINFRIFYCGEYGKKSNRPHFHALFFSPVAIDRDEFRRVIASKWTLGFTKTDLADSGSAWYVSKYVVPIVSDNSVLDKLPREFRPFCQSPKYLGFHYLSPENVNRFKSYIITKQYEKICYQFAYNGSSVSVPLPPAFFRAIFTEAEREAYTSYYLGQSQKEVERRLKELEYLKRDDELRSSSGFQSSSGESSFYGFLRREQIELDKQAYSDRIWLRDSSKNEVI
ncbi:MAG: replication initiation protein [Microviridae sp.]|nr:MAG: replication initiation protein [Microviridae sp.]